MLLLKVGGGSVLPSIFLCEGILRYSCYSRIVQQYIQIDLV